MASPDKFGLTGIEANVFFFRGYETVTRDSHKSPACAACRRPKSANGRQRTNQMLNIVIRATNGNAVAAALASFGAEPKELPLTPPRIWRLIEEAKARSLARDDVFRQG